MSRIQPAVKLIWEYIVLTVGVFLYGFAWNAFMIPQEMSGGALTGVAAIIQYATGGLIPLSYSYFAINACLVIIGTIILGKGFGFKTIYCIVCSSFFLWLLPQVEWVTKLSDIEDNLLNAIIAGGVSALGIAFVFKKGGSTGGTDILALVLNKFYPISPGKVFLYADLIIVGSIYLLPGKGLSDVVYGYIYTFSFSYMVDLFLSGGTQSIKVIIISKKYKEIADMLIHQNRGVTALNSVGWYSGQESKVLMIIARKTQMGVITSSIKEVDPSAFVSIANVMAVYGNGFEQIKTGPKIKSKENKITRMVNWLKR